MYQFVALAGAAFSAYGQQQAGKAAAQQGRLQQAMYEQERRQNEIETMQRHNDRMAAYDSARASNSAWFAFSGRDPSDRSVKAFLNKQREVAYTDVARSDAQGFVEGQQLAFQGQMARFGGETKRRGYQIQAITTLASGLHDYGSVKTT